MTNYIDLASDPETSPIVLDHLAYSDNLDVRKAVIANPSTPLVTLAMLAEIDFDQEVRIRASVILSYRKWGNQ